MPNVLDVFALPRGARSRTLRLREAFLRGYTSKHPQAQRLELDLARDHARLPSIDEWDIQAKFEMMYGEGKLDGEAAKHWNAITQLTDQLHFADLIVLSCPMWNFGVPWMVKKWIDCVAQARLTWEHQNGVYQGLLKGRAAVILTTRDGAYAAGTPYETVDFQLPYLRQMFGFLGIDPVHVVVGEPMMALGRDAGVQALEKACSEAETLGRSL